MPQLDVGSSISYGWKKFTENVGPFIILMLAVLVVSFVLNLIQGVAVNATDGSFVVSTIMYFVVLAGTLILQAGVIRAGLGVTKGVTPSVSQLTESENLVPYILTSIVVSIGVFVGFILCIIPGIAFAIFAAYAGVIALDKGLGPVDAIKQSIDLVKNNFGQVFLILLVSYVVYIIGACLCGIGLLVSGPVALVAIVYSYRALNNELVTP